MKGLINKILSNIIIYIIPFFCVIGLSNQTYAISTTITYVGTANDIGGGTYIWNNINNIIGDTTNTSGNSTISTQNDYTNFISLTNFNLSSAGLPTGSIINGIQVDVETLASGRGIKDTTIQLTKDGTNTLGNNYGNNVNRDQTKMITTYGGLTDLWGTTWTYSELNSSNFGVIIQYRNTNRNTRTVDLYRVGITIDYIPNNIPTDITLSNQDIPSSVPIGSTIGTMTTTDLDTTDTHTYSFACSTPGIDDSSFSISGSDLNSGEVFDDTVKSSYSICLKTDDGRGGTFDKNFTITILSPAPNNPPTDINLSNNIIFENLSIGSLVGSLTTTDSDTWNTHTYSLSCTTPGTDDSSFSISGSNLNSNQVYNQNRKASYNICIRTDDGEGGTFDKNFTININVIDFETVGGYSITNGIWNRVTTDFFEGAYSIESDNLGVDNSTSCFEASREIIVDSTINFYRKVDSEASYDFLRFYIDGVQQAEWAGAIAWSQVSYNVGIGSRTFKWCYEKDGSVANGADKAWVDFVQIIEPINNIPTDITLSNQDIQSDLPIGSLVGTMTTTDADTTDTHNYSLSCSTPGVDDISFSVSGSDLLSGEIFDDTVKSNYNICLRTNDGRGGTFDKNFTINILPPTPNNPPTDITLSNNIIFENLSIGSLIGSFTTTDTDTADTHTYDFSCSIPGIDDANFSISGSNLNSGEIFNLNRKSTYNICIKTDDGRGGTFDKNFTINVSVLDFETVGGYSVISGIWNRVTTDFFEGAYSIESDNLGVDNSTSCFEANREINIDSAIKFYRKVDSEASYDFLRFYIDGVQQDEWAGAIGWSQVSYNIGAGSHTFKWCYEKDGSVANGADKAWVDYIQIIEPNPPTDINLSSNNINEELAIGSLVGTMTTTDTDIGDTFTYSFGCTTPGIDDTSFIISGSNLNSNDIYDFDIKSSYNICLRTTDSYGLTLDKNFTININNVDQNPTDILLSNNSISENFPIGSLVGNLSSTDPDTPDTHTYSFTCATAGADDASFNISSSDLVSAEVFDTNVKTTYNICLRTTDNTGLTFDKNFTINITVQIISPGGVGLGLQIWLKADAGTSTTTDGTALASWADQSGNGFNAAGGVSPTYLNNTNLNFNPLIDFNGTDQYLENLNNGAFTQGYYAVIVPNTTIDGTVSGQVPFGFDCNSGVLNTGTCGLTFAGLTIGAFTAAINDEVITNAIGSSTSRRSAQIGAYSYEANKPMLIGMNENVSATNTDIYEKGVKIDNYTANAYQNLSTADYNIGRSPDATYPFYYNGKIAEIINYDAGQSDLSRQKIESYLSIKYGITLNGGATDYIASNGTSTFWSTTSAGTYINDIFAITRDDLSELSQIKSKSVNNDSVITIEAVSEGTNIAPNFVDINDLESLSISNNDGGNTWTATDVPSGYNNLSRIWKVQEVGDIGTINLDFDVDNLNFDIPVLSIGTDYYFIYDSNNDSSLADENPIVMINTIGSIWQIAGINMNNGQIFTIATAASTNNIPTDITLLNNTIDENSLIGATIGTLSTTDADSGDTHTYSLVAGTGDDDNVLFSITSNTLSINTSADFEIKNSYTVRVQTDDGNGGQFQKAFTININNTGETIDSIIDFEELDDENRYNITSGTWTRTTNNPNEGLYSIESSNPLDSTQSCFEVVHTLTATGTITFDYSVSSELNSDYMRFYIDNIEDQAWSGDVAWTTYTKNNLSAGFHSYKWCYIKDASGAAGTDNSWIDYITINSAVADITPPNITSINYASGTLLPGGNHNIIINYNDTESGINTTSDIISLNKWDGTVWGSDISSTGFDLATKSITTSNATYPTNNLVFGKYRYNFSIPDNDGNTSSTGAIFYIDEVELIISTGALDIGGLENGITKFSTGELNITVKTVGAGFDIILNKDSALTTGSVEIIDWNGVEGVGFDQSPYTSTINIININEIIASQIQNINIDGNKNTYIYSIKLGSLIGEQQAAGNYSSNIRFGIDLNY